MEPFQLPFHTPDGRDPLQQLQDEYSIPLDERGQIDYQKLSGATAGPVEAPQQQQQQVQEDPRKTTAIKKELARRAAARIIQEQDYSAAPRVVRGDGTDEVLPDINAVGGGRKEGLASKGEYGGGISDWVWSIGGEVGGYEATKSRDQGDVVSDDDINEMLQGISDKNYATFGSQYTLDPQEFKSQFKAHALAKSMVTRMSSGVEDVGWMDEKNFQKIFRNMSPSEQFMFSNALDSMAKDEGIDEGPVDRFLDSLGRGFDVIAHVGEGVANLFGSKSDEQIEGEQIEMAAKALIEEKLAPSGIVGGTLNTAGEILPPMLTGGYIGKAVGATAAAAGAGTKLASGVGKVAAGGYWFDMEVGDIKDRLRAAGLDDSDATRFAIPAAAAIAAMEFAQVGRFAKKYKGSNKELLAKVLEQTGGFKEKVLKNAATRTITKIGKTGIQESGQEALQQAMEEGTMFLASKMHDSDFDLGESFDNVRHAFTDSVLAMAVIGAPGAVSGHLAEKRGVEALRSRMAVMEQGVSGRIDNLVLAASKSHNLKEFDELLDWAANPERAQEAFPDILRDALQGQEGVLDAPIESLEEFMGDRLKKAIVESVDRNRDTILEGREGSQQYIDYWIDESLGNAEERARSQAVSDILVEHIENNPKLADKLADLINDDTLSRKAFKDLLLSDGGTFRRDGSVNPETPSGKLMLNLLEHIGSTGADAEVKQKYTAAELMNLSAADFNAWVGEVSEVPGQYVPEFKDLDAAVEAHPSTRETGQRRRKMRKEVEDSFAPGVSSAQERARLINEYMPEAKFILPTSLLRLGNQNQRQRKIFSGVMKANLSLWMKDREVARREGLSPAEVRLEDLEAQLARETEAGDTEAMENTRLRIVGAQQAASATQAQEAGQAQQVGPQQEAAAVEAQQEETQQTPLDEAGVERIVNTIGDMFGEQGVIENEERVFEVIETALSGETEAKIEAQRELINIMGQLSEGKELSYEEHGWEPLPEDEKKVKELGDTFARLVDMGYLQHLDEISAKDVRALGLDHAATLQAAVEINKRIHAGEEVSREEMDNIIYEKHTGEELRVRRAANRTTMEAMALSATQEVALAGKKGRKLEPTVTVPRSQMTEGEFVFTDPGTRGIGQLGKMLGEERRGKAAPEPKRGDPVVQEPVAIEEADIASEERLAQLDSSMAQEKKIRARRIEKYEQAKDSGEKIEAAELKDSIGKSTERLKSMLAEKNQIMRAGRRGDPIAQVEQAEPVDVPAEQAAPQEGSQESVMPDAVQQMGIYNWEDLEGYAEAQDIDPYEFASQLGIKTPSSDMSDADRAAKVKEINIAAVDTFEEERLLVNEAEKAGRSGNGARLAEIMGKLPDIAKKKKKQIRKKMEVATTEQKAYWEGVLDGNIDPVLQPPKDNRVKAKPKKRPKSKPAFESKSATSRNELSQTASDTFGPDTHAYMEALQQVTDSEEAALMITRLAAKNKAETVEETIQNALAELETHGIALKEVDGKKVIDTSPTTVEEVTENPIRPERGDTVDEVEGASWWGGLTESEKFEHLKQGTAMVNIQLRRLGLEPIKSGPELEDALHNPNFSGGRIARSVYDGDSDIISVEVFFTPSSGKDFGAFAVDVIREGDVSEEGRKQVMASATLPHDWAKKSGIKGTKEEIKKMHRDIIQKLVDEKLDFVISNKVKTYYSGVDGIFAGDVIPPAAASDLDSLLAQSVEHEEELDEYIADILYAIEDEADIRDFYNDDTGEVDLSALAPFIDNAVPEDIDIPPDVVAAYLWDNVPDAIFGRVMELGTREAETTEPGLEEKYESPFDYDELLMTNDGEILHWGEIQDRAFQQAEGEFPDAEQDSPEWIGKYNSTIETYGPRKATAAEISEAGLTDPKRGDRQAPAGEAEAAEPLKWKKIKAGHYEAEVGNNRIIIVKDENEVVDPITKKLGRNPLPWSMVWGEKPSDENLAPELIEFSGSWAPNPAFETLREAKEYLEESREMEFMGKSIAKDAAREAGKQAPAGPQEGPSTLESTPTWNLPEIEVDTGDLLPHLTIDGDKATFIDRKGNRRSIDEFATEASQRVSEESNVDDWINLPAADTKIDIDHILTIAPGLEYIGIKKEKGTDVHAFKAAHGEILYMRAVKFIPHHEEAAGYSEEDNKATEEFFKKTGVSMTSGIHLSFPGQKKPHAILISDFGLAFPNEKDGGAELEEIIHWAQTSGRWSPEINDFLQKEFSEQALVAGKGQADKIEDTAKGLAVAITKALKHRDPVAVGKLRSLLRKMLDWFNDFLVANALKPMNVDYIVNKWLNGEIISNPETMKSMENVMKRQRDWSERKKLSEEKQEELRVGAREIDDMHTGAGLNTARDAAVSLEESMSSRIGRLARIKKGFVKIAHILLDNPKTNIEEKAEAVGAAAGALTSVNSYLRQKLRVVPLEGGKEARKLLLNLQEEREGFVQHYRAIAIRHMEEINRAFKRMGAEQSEELKEIMHAYLKDPNMREEFEGILVSEIKDPKQRNVAEREVGVIAENLMALRNTIDNLSQIVIDDVTQRSEEMAVIIDENGKVYVTRKYRLHEDPEARMTFLRTTEEGRELVASAVQATRDIDKRKKYDKYKESLYQNWRAGEIAEDLDIKNVVSKDNEFRSKLKGDFTRAQIDMRVDALLRGWFMTEMESAENIEMIDKAAEGLAISIQEAQDLTFKYLHSPNSYSSGSSSDTGFARDIEQFMKRRKLDNAYKDLYGEIRGARAAGITIASLAENIAGHTFQKSIRESALFDNHIAPESNDKLNITVPLIGREYGTLDGMFVTPEFEFTLKRLTGQLGLFNHMKNNQGSAGSDMAFAVLGASVTAKMMKTTGAPRTASRNSWEETMHAWINGWWSPISSLINSGQSVLGVGEGSSRASFRQAMAISEHHADLHAHGLIKYIANPGLGNVKFVFGNKMKGLDEYFDTEALELYEEVAKLGLLNNSLQRVWDEQREAVDVKNPLDVASQEDTEDIKVGDVGRSRAVSRGFRKFFSSAASNKYSKGASKLYQVSSDATRVMGYVTEKRRINEAIAWEVADKLKGKNKTKSEIDAAVIKEQKKREKATNREAADKVKDLIPTASRVSQLVKEWSAFPVLGNFPVWFTGYIKSMTNQWRIGMGEATHPTNPKTRRVGQLRLSRAAFTQIALGAAARSIHYLLGLDDEDEEAIKNALPFYQRNNTLIPIPATDGEGFSVFDVTQSFPSTMFFDIAATSVNSFEEDGISGVLESGLGEAASMFTDEDIFMSSVADILLRGGENKFGYQILDPLDSKTEKVFKVLDHWTFGLGEGFRGPLAPGFLAEADRLKQAVFDGETPSGVKRSIKGALSRIMIGSESVSFDAPKRLTMEAKEFTETRREYTRSVNKAGYSSNSAKFKKALASFEEKNAKLYNDMNSVVHAARLGGMSDADIVQRLQKFGVPKTDIEHWMADKVRGTTMSKKTLQGIYRAGEEDREGGGQEILDVYKDYVKRGDRGE